MRHDSLKGFGAALALACCPAFGQDRQQVAIGADIYSRNCSPCHGTRMLDPQGAFDLRKFPREQRERFVDSVTKGKNQMPPWGGLLKPEEIEALWLYVIAGERG
jgi:mono/diheme cytochrome c family protein